MTNIITVSMTEEIVNKIDEYRKSLNITRSKLFRDIITYAFNNKDIIKKALNNNVK